MHYLVGIDLSTSVERSMSRKREAVASTRAGGASWAAS